MSLFGTSNKECPSCALETEASQEVCPYCGYEFPAEQTGRTMMAWFFLALIILWLITRI